MSANILVWNFPRKKVDNPLKGERGAQLLRSAPSPPESNDALLASSLWGRTDANPAPFSNPCANLRSEMASCAFNFIYKPSTQMCKCCSNRSAMTRPVVVNGLSGVRKDEYPNTHCVVCMIESGVKFLKNLAHGCLPHTTVQTVLSASRPSNVLTVIVHEVEL